MQIRFFYPELDHPAFGVMRAIAKDGTDTETGSSAVVFLDSDNMASLTPSVFPDTWSGPSDVCAAPFGYIAKDTCDLRSTHHDKKITHLPS